MNMLSPNAHQSEFRRFREQVRPAPVPATSKKITFRRFRPAYLGWAVAILAIGYAITTLGAVAVWILAGLGVGLAVLATAVCMYALNNTIDLF